MKKKDAKKREVVSVRFSAIAHFDALIELTPRNIAKLKAAIDKEFSEGESWQRLLLSQASTASFDFVFRDEDIEIDSADILKGYPHQTKRIDL